MAHIRIALSIEESLFQKAEKIAEEMKISRSELYSLAARDYLKRHGIKVPAPKKPAGSSRGHKQ
jgi:metal-responsive CopG/Arc/MetJ family transcriptional regulator